MKTPAGGHRDTQWVIQHRSKRQVEIAGVDMPEAELLWIRYGIALTGPATKAALKELREEAPEHDWRAIRIETVQRVEDW